MGYYHDTDYHSHLPFDLRSSLPSSSGVTVLLPLDDVVGGVLCSVMAGGGVGGLVEAVIVGRGRPVLPGGLEVAVEEGGRGRPALPEGLEVAVEEGREG